MITAILILSLVVVYLIAMNQRLKRESKEAKEGFDRKINAKFPAYEHTSNEVWQIEKDGDKYIVNVFKNGQPYLCYEPLSHILLMDIMTTEF